MIGGNWTLAVCYKCQFKFYLFCCQRQSLTVHAICQSCAASCNLVGSEPCGQCSKPNLKEISQLRLQILQEMDVAPNHNNLFNRQQRNHESNLNSQMANRQGNIPSNQFQQSNQQQRVIPNNRRTENNQNWNHGNNQGQGYPPEDRTRRFSNNNSWKMQKPEPQMFQKEQSEYYFSPEDVRLISRGAELPMDFRPRLQYERKKAGVGNGNFEVINSWDRVENPTESDGWTEDFE